MLPERQIASQRRGETPRATTSTDIDVMHVIEATNAGVRRHMVDLVRGLSALGFTQSVVYSPLRADAALWTSLHEFKVAGVSVIALPMTREISPVADGKSFIGLSRLVGRHRPRVLHAHSSKAGGLARSVAVRFPGMRTVYTPNASPANVSYKYLWIERALGRIRTDRIVAVSRSEFDEIVGSRLVPAGRCVQIDSGIDLEEVVCRASARPELELPNGSLVVASGRICSQKNPLLLAEASRIVAARVPAARFVWIGDGEDRPALERRLHDLGVADRWTITGWMSNPFPVVARAHVFVVPSAYESFGYVTLEAMALRRPIVATKVTGSRDLVLHDETGFLVPPDRSEALADAIVVLLSDASRAEKMANAAAARSRHFSLDRMATQTAGLYAELGVTPSGHPTERAARA